MVCTIQSGRMASIKRVLKNGVISEVSQDLAIHEKVAFQTLQRELHDADESNLLDEEDMHVFGCRPLTDPLHLVCCNACKKPVMASQYAAHAGQCRLSHYGNDPSLVSIAGSCKKKPSRKGRKTLEEASGNQGVTTEERDKHMSINETDVNRPRSNFESRSGLLSAQPREIPRTKFQKLTARTGTASNIPSRCHNEAQVLENDLFLVESACASKVPAPLATKIYYSQGSHRLRLQLGHLYQRATAREVESGSKCEEKMQDNAIISHLNNGQILGQSSDPSSGAVGVSQPVTSFTNQFQNSNISKLDVPDWSK